MLSSIDVDELAMEPMSESKRQYSKALRVINADNSDPGEPFPGTG